MAYRFDCPKCKRERVLEVVSSNVVISQTVSELYPYGEFETEGPLTKLAVGSHRFQCETCGHVVAEDRYELEKWANETQSLGIRK